MGIREGLSFSDYFDDSIPYEVKPVPSTIPMEEDEEPVRNYGDDYPLRAKDLFKGLWETEQLRKAGFTSFWLDKIGNFHSAGSSHLFWAKSYLQKHHIAYDEYKVIEKLYKQGFIRISLYRSSKEIYFDYDKRIGPPDKNQMASLKNAAIELGFVLRDGITDKEVELTESLLFEDILEEAARILPAHAGYWMDPQGNFHDTGIGGHMEWAKKYMAMKGLPYHNEINQYEPLCKLGFIRVITDEHLMLIRYSKSKPPTNFQWKILKDTAIESGLILHDDVTNKNIDLTESSNLNENRGVKELFIESSNMMPDDTDTFKSHLAQLFAYIQKELKLKTVPKVKLLSDEKNAAKVLGKTAYYDPHTRTVNLYVTDRHQKDILRSFAHETVHHWQHENEQLQTSKAKGKPTGESEDPQYAQHNPWLRQMEKQAYLLGNILFRDWEDQKKAKDRKSGKKMVEKTYLMGKEYPPRKMDYSG